MSSRLAVPPPPPRPLEQSAPPLLLGATGAAVGVELAHASAGEKKDKAGKTALTRELEGGLPILLATKPYAELVGEMETELHQ